MRAYIIKNIKSYLMAILHIDSIISGAYRSRNKKIDDYRKDIFKEFNRVSSYSRDKRNLVNDMRSVLTDLQKSVEEKTLKSNG